MSDTGSHGEAMMMHEKAVEGEGLEEELTEGRL
jgi:hypothetical protein